MNQLQFSQAQSPRESNFDFEDLPQLQEQQINESKLSASIFTDVYYLFRLQIKIFGTIYLILLILFNSYIVFDLTYKISLLYVTILHFLQVVRLAINNYNNILNDHNCCLELFWGILSISYYGCFFYFIDHSNFPIQYPTIMYFVFTLSWIAFLLHAYRQNKQETNIISLFTVFCKLLLTAQLMLINFRQINWLQWDWIYIFSIVWAFLMFAIILQFIFIIDFIMKVIITIKETNILKKQALNQQIICSLWINLIILSISGLLTFTIVSYSILLSTEKKPFNFIPIIICIVYSLVIAAYTCYFKRTLNQFLMTFQREEENQNDNNQFSSPSSKRRSIFTRDKNKINIKLPQFLIKLSQTYFQPQLIGQQYQSQKQIQSLSEIKQEKRNKTDIEQPKQSNQNSLTELKVEKDQNCFNCYQNESCAVYMPCGHGGLCIKCATEWFVEKQECLICRKPVEQVVKVIESNSNTFQIVDVIAF
ncbi:unnamed protein product [Paramecium primaurelia]|uniref:RING-type domain-containing protein n=1 Tax=Paramecium primaurelia TaxID=5886 RepID=A0A8S1LIE8_PARPR|nr:unnamed protein product [Paramecium primaurelia]